jgi:hypothetical protein
MLGCVQPLPYDPDLVRKERAIELPLEPCFIRPLEGQRLALERRQQPVEAIAIRSARRRPPTHWKCAEHELGAPPADNESENRPDKIERTLGAEALIAESADRHAHAVVEIDVGLETQRGAEDRLAFPERIVEFSVVPVEQ